MRYFAHVPHFGRVVYKALGLSNPSPVSGFREQSVDLFHRSELSRASLHIMTRSTISSNQVVAGSRVQWRQGNLLGRNQRPTVRLAFKGERPIAIGVVDRKDVVTDAASIVLQYLRRSGELSKICSLRAAVRELMASPQLCVVAWPVKNPAASAALTMRAKREFLQERVACAVWKHHDLLRWRHSPKIHGHPEIPRSQSTQIHPIHPRHR
ncbi:Uncharacterized protein HZ326_29081 [Fusarium oxysporum f. sp. albedinis]|nr:Uncharacterized protein HZ326_29081 [Fusarium oxysporum f. sp. albedinis]